MRVGYYQDMVVASMPVYQDLLDHIQVYIIGTLLFALALFLRAWLVLAWPPSLTCSLGIERAFSANLLDAIRISITAYGWPLFPRSICHWSPVCMCRTWYMVCVPLHDVTSFLEPKLLLCNGLCKMRKLLTNTVQKLLLCNVLCKMRKLLTNTVQKN